MAADCQLALEWQGGHNMCETRSASQYANSAQYAKKQQCCTYCFQFAFFSLCSSTIKLIKNININHFNTMSTNSTIVSAMPNKKKNINHQKILFIQYLYILHLEMKLNNIKRKALNINKRK